MHEELDDKNLGKDQSGAGFFLCRTNEEGLELLRSFEGLRLEAYRCPAQIWTIGYGHTRTAEPGMRITREQAETLLQSDLYLYEKAVQRLVEVPLNRNQFSALVCFAFNVGIGNLERSTLLKLLNRGWYDQVPAQLMRWTRTKGQVLGGLSRRRAAEAQLWNKTENKRGVC